MNQELLAIAARVDDLSALVRRSTVDIDRLNRTIQDARDAFLRFGAAWAKAHRRKAEGEKP